MNATISVPSTITLTFESHNEIADFYAIFNHSMTIEGTSLDGIDAKIRQLLYDESKSCLYSEAFRKLDNKIGYANHFTCKKLKDENADLQRRLKIAEDEIAKLKEALFQEREVTCSQVDTIKRNVNRVMVLTDELERYRTITKDVSSGTGWKS